MTNKLSETPTNMPIEDYLAQGGVLTSPFNVPARYRGELLRLMSSFVDSELAASAAFADTINFSRSIRERISASLITLEKADHAERVLRIMGDFGTDTRRYQLDHDWAARLPRDTDPMAARREGDMRLAVFHYPLIGWSDAVVMNVLQGLATQVQMEELTRVSYTPLAEVFREIAPREARHVATGLEGLAQIVNDPQGREETRTAIAYWQPRVALSFGSSGSERYDLLARFGLRHKRNEELLASYEKLVAEQLQPLGL